MKFCSRSQLRLDTGPLKIKTNKVLRKLDMILNNKLEKKTLEENQRKKEQENKSRLLKELFFIRT